MDYELLIIFSSQESLINHSCSKTSAGVDDIFGKSIMHYCYTAS